MRPTVHFSLLSMLLSEIQLGTQDAMHVPPFSPSEFLSTGFWNLCGEWLGEQHACYLVEAAALSVLRVNAVESDVS